MLVSRNIISDISDHFSQFCILSSIVDQPKENKKVRDFSKFSSLSFIAELLQVDWDEIIARGTDDLNKIFSSFYNKLNKIVNKRAPFRTISKRRKKKLKNKGTKSDFKQRVDIVKKCKYCGTTHNVRQCPAYGKECNKCNMKNHFADVHRSY